MKTENLLLWGGAAFIAYKLFIQKKQQTITPGMTYNPGSPALLPVSAGSTPVSAGVNTLTSAAGTIISKLFPSASPVPAASPAAGSPSPGFSQEINNLFPQTTFTPLPNGFVQEDTSGLFNAPSSSTFASDTSYLQMLEEDQINS